MKNDQNGHPNVQCTNQINFCYKAWYVVGEIFFKGYAFSFENFFNQSWNKKIMNFQNDKIHNFAILRFSLDNTSETKCHSNVTLSRSSKIYNRWESDNSSLGQGCDVFCEFELFVIQPYTILVPNYTNQDLFWIV